jgi:hypothetical protein
MKWLATLWSLVAATEEARNLTQEIVHVPGVRHLSRRPRAGFLSQEMDKPFLQLLAGRLPYKV